MKLRKIAASIVAAAIAFSTVAFSAFAEEAKDEKLTLLSADLTSELRTNMVFVEGVGVVDITGVEFDSSENGAADENANLDVDFDGIGYLSKENLKIWQETGVLTLEKLKADFDTTGLKLGKFNAAAAKNGYVQLLKMEHKFFPNEYGGYDDDVVTYRGLYKIENGEIKKCCDLDNFWTFSRPDGVSFGLKTESREGFVNAITENIGTDITWLKLSLVITQPDGTKKETVLATRDADKIFESYDKDVEYIRGADEEIGIAWSYYTDTADNLVATIGYIEEYDHNYSHGIKHKIIQVFEDGTIKEIYEGDGYFGSVLGNDQQVVWNDYGSPSTRIATIYHYDTETGKTETYDLSNIFERESSSQSITPEEHTKPFYNLNSAVNFYGNYYIANLQVYNRDENDEREYLKNGYILLNGLKDFDNWESKTCYEIIVAQGDVDGNTDLFRFETKDGKTGYMNSSEKVLAEFDVTDGFEGKYAPVVKSGKAYLIDKDMKAVSTEIEAEDIDTFDEELFVAMKDGKTYFVTYGEADNPITKVVFDYSDNEVKASANKGVIDDGAKFVVKFVSDKTDDTKSTFELSFEKDGAEVKPNGKVTVKIPVPSAMRNKNVYVFRTEADGTYTNMNARVEDGYVVFETDHFSEYVVTTDGAFADTSDSSDSSSSSDSETSSDSSTSSDSETSSDSQTSSSTSSDSNSSGSSGSDKTPETGFGGAAMTIGVFALAGAAVVVTKKHQR